MIERSFSIYEITSAAGETDVETVLRNAGCETVFIFYRDYERDHMISVRVLLPDVTTAQKLRKRLMLAGLNV